MNNPPAYYEDRATLAEKEGRLLDAAQEWRHAAGASIGHGRAARYNQAAAECEIKWRTAAGLVDRCVVDTTNGAAHITDLHMIDALLTRGNIIFVKTRRTPQDTKDDAAAYIPLREVREGEYFRMQRFDKGAVYKRGHYCCGLYNGKRDNRYSCENQTNGNELMINGDKLVFVGFEH